MPQHHPEISTCTCEYREPLRPESQGPVSGQAGMDFLNPMLSLYLQAQANADKASLFNSETYADFFRKNPDGNTDFDLQNVQFGKVVNGKPVSLVYMDQAGVRSQEVPIRTIQKDNKVIAKQGAIIARILPKQDTGVEQGALFLPLLAHELHGFNGYLKWKIKLTSNGGFDEFPGGVLNENDGSVKGVVRVEVGNNEVKSLL